MKIETLELGPLADTGSAPLYRLVKRELQRAIESGRCAPGRAFPLRGPSHG